MGGPAGLNGIAPRLAPRGGGMKSVVSGVAPLEFPGSLPGGPERKDIDPEAGRFKSEPTVKRPNCALGAFKLSFDSVTGNEWFGPGLYWAGGDCVRDRGGMSGCAVARPCSCKSFTHIIWRTPSLIVKS